jgi:Glucodextranase, domain B/Bacterial Ig domain
VNDGTVDSEPDTALVTVTVPPDTTPPTPADLGKITVGEPVNGQVTVTGTAGSVEGNSQVRITNPRTGQITTVTATADGSFTATIPAQAGDQLALVVTDAAGNSSTVATTVVGRGSGGSIGGSPPQISITSPIQGVLIAQNRTQVTGTVQGSFNTGVVVNGIIALVHNNTFVADNVPLVAGQNTLAVEATALGTQSTQVQVTVTSEGAPVALEVQASPTSRIGPLAVTFAYQFSSTTPFQNLSMDFDGNGTVDFTTTDPNAPLQYTYTAPGLYVAQLQATDQQSIRHTANVTIVVHDTVVLDAMFKNLWSGMNTALLNGDIATALLFLDSAAQAKYEQVWRVLQPHMADIVASYSPVRALSISDSIGEYGLNRTINGEKRLFLIYFLKNDDGVWRLTAM